VVLALPFETRRTARSARPNTVTEDCAAAEAVAARAATAMADLSIFIVDLLQLRKRLLCR
jgi:hypothetical protein